MLGNYKGDTTNDESLMDEDLDYIEDEEAEEAKNNCDGITGSQAHEVESILVLRQ